MERGGCVIEYEIEALSVDHPALLTIHLEASTVARCRESSGSPWILRTRCERLPRTGNDTKHLRMTWQPSTESRAIRAERTHQANRLTEDAAIGVCAATFAALAEGEITEVTMHGTGVDYWVDKRRGVVEISGLRKGDVVDLQQRHAEKRNQLLQSSLRKLGYAGYIFAVSFQAREALLTYEP